MKPTEVPIQFHDSFITFLDELIELFPSEGDLIVIRVILKSTIPPEQLISMFIKEAIPHKQEIKDRNDEYFLNSTLFDFVGKDKSQHIKNLWRSSVLTVDDRQVIWEWFDVFIYLAEQYQKNKVLEVKG